MSRRIRHLVLTASGLLVASVLVAVSATSVSAGGCTLRGTSGNDRLVGTSAKDIICGFGGDDVLLGYGGNDVLQGGPGSDTLKGGAGADLLVPDIGNDDVSGGTGVDRATYGDSETGGVRIDLDGVADDGTKGERDNIRPDVENLTGSDYADVLIGSDVPNVLEGMGGDDVIRGGPGDDVLIGGNSSDELYGEDGNDVLQGGTYADLMVGGLGADVMNGGTSVGSAGNICDIDPADTVTDCLLDSSGPEAYLSGWYTYDPGESFLVHLTTVDVGGVARAALRITLAGGEVVMCPAMTRAGGSRDSEESYWTVRCQVPPGAQLGGYVMAAVLEDRVGNVSIGVPGRGAVTFAVRGPDDGTGPVLDGVEMDDADRVVSPGDTFRVMVSASDPSGIVSTIPILRQAHAAIDCGSARWVAGDATSGTWRIPCTVPQIVRNGTWTLSGQLRDSYGNNTWEESNPSTTFEVVGGSDDVTPPAVSDVRVSRASAAPGDTFTVTVDVTDETGVDSLNGVSTYSYLSGYPGGSWCLDTPQLIFGNEKDGTWSIGCRVPDNTGAGDWTISTGTHDVLQNMGTAPHETFDRILTVT